jgi:acrylyl-CoA reductase (NADPH)
MISPRALNRLKIASSRSRCKRAEPNGGITAAPAPLPKRVAAWERLAHELDASKLAAITQEIALADAVAHAPDLLAGKVRGRLVVNVNA